jgi:hypothetical protein
MQKATLTEIAIIVTSGIVAGSLANELADHGVAVMAIVTTVLATLTTGLYLARQIGDGLRTSLFTCPTKGCTTSIRASGTNQTELARIQAFATDHTKHGSNR